MIQTQHILGMDGLIMLLAGTWRWIIHWWNRIVMFNISHMGIVHTVYDYIWKTETTYILYMYTYTMWKLAFSVLLLYIEFVILLSLLSHRSICLHLWHINSTFSNFCTTYHIYSLPKRYQKMNTCFFMEIFMHKLHGFPISLGNLLTV